LPLRAKIKRKINKKTKEKFKKIETINEIDKVR